MVRLTGYMLNHYFGVPFEQFRAKLVCILGIFTLIEPGIEEDEKVKKMFKRDYDELRFIEEYTHPDVMVSWYKLARFYNKEASFKVTRRIKFLRTDFKQRAKENRDPNIDLNEDEIDMWLSKQIRRCHDLLVKNVKFYNEDRKIPIFDDDEEDIIMEDITGKKPKEKT